MRKGEIEEQLDEAIQNESNIGEEDQASEDEQQE
jgi:hypothetical protein